MNKEDVVLGPKKEFLSSSLELMAQGMAQFTNDQS